MELHLLQDATSTNWNLDNFCVPWHKMLHLTRNAIYPVILVSQEDNQVN